MSVGQVSGVAGGATGTGLGGITGTLQGSVNNLVNIGQGWFDRFFPPEKREELKEKLSRFATERPYLASFLLSHIALSGLPLALFIIMVMTVAIFALLAGILVGLLGALLFILGAVGFALVILLPTLFITTFFAVAIWLWGVGGYFIIKWFNEKKVPGIHVPLKDSIMEGTGLNNLPAIQDLPLVGGESAAKSTDSSSANTTGIDKKSKAEKRRSTQHNDTNGTTTKTTGVNTSSNNSDKKDGHTRERAQHKPKKLEQKSRSNSVEPQQQVQDHAEQAVNGVGGAVKGLGKGVTG